MSFFEMYRQNIPMFTPSLSLLIKWHQKYHLLSGRIYGRPERHIDLILNNTLQQNTIPDPNDDLNLTSNYYWLKYTDTYVFPHISRFDSWDHLLELLSETNYTNVRERMSEFNNDQKVFISSKWDEIFKKLIPNRRTNKN